MRSVNLSGAEVVALQKKALRRKRIKAKKDERKRKSFISRLLNKKEK